MRGNRHTWNTIGYSTGILIDIRKLKKYSLVSNDLYTETGVTIRELLIFLRNYKRTLNYNGFIYCSVGGAISTDTHGSFGLYRSNGAFNSLITEITYIDGKGILNTINTKSTLAKLLIKLYKPDAGSILINIQDIDSEFLKKKNNLYQSRAEII